MASFWRVLRSFCRSGKNFTSCQYPLINYLVHHEALPQRQPEIQQPQRLLLTRLQITLGADQHPVPVAHRPETEMSITTTIIAIIVTIARLWIRYRLKKIMNVSFSYWEWLSWVQLAVFSLYWVLYFGFILCISGKLGTQVSKDVLKYQVEFYLFFLWGHFW